MSILNETPYDAKTNRLASGEIFTRDELIDVDKVDRDGLARLNDDGSLDADFIDPMLNGSVRDLLVLSNGEMLGAGSFTTVGSVPHDRIARLT